LSPAFSTRVGSESRPHRGRLHQKTGLAAAGYKMDASLALVRFAHFVAAMFVFGAGVYLSAFTPPALRQNLSPQLRRAAIVAGLVVLLSALIWFALEGASMSGDWASAYDPDVLSDVLTSTTFGAVWSVRVPLIVLLVAALIFTPSERWAVATVLSALVLASLAFIDHGAMQTGSVGAAHRANDAVHLLTAGGWLGALTPFAMCVRAVQRQEFCVDAGAAMLRFSAVAHLAVLALILTGAANIALTSGHWPWPPTSPYRALLSFKMAIVAIMIVTAIVNRYVLLPLIETRHGAAAALRVLSLAEFALALVIVALVSVFGLLDPA
jgi:putative copper resistance protein D